MPRQITVNEKYILLRDRDAILLAKKRAKREGRSAANAAAVSIIECLKERNQNEGTIC
jgi:hypothetical protein